MEGQTHHLRDIWALILRNGKEGVAVSNEDLQRLELLFVKGKWFLTPLPLLMMVWAGTAVLVPSFLLFAIFAVHNLMSFVFLIRIKNWEKVYSSGLRIWELFGAFVLLTFLHLVIGVFEYNGAYMIVILHGLLVGGYTIGLWLLLFAFPIMYLSNLAVAHWGQVSDYSGALSNAIAHEIIFFFLIFMVLWIVGQRNLYRTDSEIDGLTGLYNHRYFYQTLTNLLDRKAQRLTIVIGDLDNFKRVNDSYGHIVGDQVLRNVSDCMRTNLPDAFLLARYGGEEFAVIFEGISLLKVNAQLESCMSALAAMSVETEQGSLHGITLSFGVVHDLTDQHAATEWVHLADDALYKAKKAGKNRIEYHIENLTSLSETGLC